MTRRPCATLSPRQIETICAVARGLSNREIAERLGIKTSTVKNQVLRIGKKLRISSRTQIAIYALQAGYIRLEDIHLYENKETINEH